MKVTKQTFATFTRKKVPLANTIHHSSFIYNQFKKLNLCKFYSNRVINHLMSILISIFISGYHGKTTDFAKNSSCHRTTIAHFLNSGKWNDSLLSDTLKQSVIEIIYSEAARTGNPVFCIVDDTIASKTKPLSRALHLIEDAYFHLAVAVMLSCNGIVLNYAFVMYNKSISKIDIVQSIAKELPVPPVMSYFLCDCWYVSEKIINTFAERGFHTIGALKTNRILYPFGIRCLLKRFLCLLQCDPMQPAALSFAIVARVRRFGRYGRYRSSTATSVSAARICFFNSSFSL